jgi:hypothetical protein
VLTWLLAGILTLLALSRILVLLARLLAGVLALLATALVALLVLLLFVGILFVCHRFVLLCCRRRNRQCNSAVTIPISGASACCTGSGVNLS